GIGDFPCAAVVPMLAGHLFLFDDDELSGGVHISLSERLRSKPLSPRAQRRLRPCTPLPAPRTMAAGGAGWLCGQTPSRSSAPCRERTPSGLPEASDRT